MSRVKRAPSTPTARVPRGVPSGGQFAASARGEASIDPWASADAPARHPFGVPDDAWTVDGPVRDYEWERVTNPSHQGVPGLESWEEENFLRLEKHVGELHADALSDTGREHYLGLASKIDTAVADGTDGWLPDCPAHTASHQMSRSGAGRWGSDPDCIACTDEGEARPVAERLTVMDRLDDLERVEAKRRVKAVAHERRLYDANAAVDRARAHFDYTADEIADMRPDQRRAIQDVLSLFDQSQFVSQGDVDYNALAEEYEYLASSRAMKDFSRLVAYEEPRDFGGVEWLKQAARRFRSLR